MSFFIEYSNIVIFVVLMIVGYTFGRIAESSHYKSIEKREKENAAIKMHSLKKIPDHVRHVEQPLVTGFVVLSNDYFKQFLALMRQIFGGRIGAYETIIDRAKREAILRLVESAKMQGAKEIYNVRIETSSISKGQNKAIVTVEVLAYGTAVR